MTKLPLTIVVAVARNGVIGDGHGLLWRLPSDLRHFKAVTMGKPMIMGRKTFESIGKPLPGRQTLVVTRDSAFAAAGVHVAHSLDAALALAETLGRQMGAEEIILAGGGDLYAQLLDQADRIKLTQIDLDVTGLTQFPAIDPTKWREIQREEGVKTAGDEACFRFVTYERCDRSGAAG